MSEPEKTPKGGHCPCCGRHWENPDGTHCHRCKERIELGLPPATPPEKGDCVHPHLKKNRSST